MHVVHLVSNKCWGGGERFTLDLCSALARSGVPVSVFSRGFPAVDGPFRQAGIPVGHLPLKGWADFLSPLRLARRLAAMPEYELVVNVHNFKDAVTAVRAKKWLRRRKKVAVVCSRHLARPAASSARHSRLYRNIDRIVFDSDFARSMFLSSSPDVDRAKLDTNLLSISLPEKYSSPVAPPSAAGADPAGPLRLLFVGRLSPEKGIEHLIEALPLVTAAPVRLSLAGTGPEDYVASLRELAAAKGVGDFVEWTGFVEDVFEAIRGADICVFPSVAREAFGLTVLEAMTQERPVVATDNGAQPEIVTSGVDGFLVPPESPAAIADALNALAASPLLREKMGQAARRTYIDRFTYDRFFRQMTLLYRKALNN